LRIINIDILNFIYTFELHYIEIYRMSKSFTLPKSIIDEYNARPSPFGFNGLGEFVYLRTYARVKDDGKLENWAETVYRVVNGTYTMQKNHILEHDMEWDEQRAQESAREMYELIFTFKFTPPGRGLWTMGTDITEKKGIYAALNNCAFISTADVAREFSKPFRFLMDQSMLGVGVGFDVAGEGKINIVAPVCEQYIGSECADKYRALLTSLIDSMNKKIDERKNTLREEGANESVIEGDWLNSNISNDIAEYKNEIAYIDQIAPAGGKSSADSSSSHRQYLIEDTREGWVNSTGALIDSYLAGSGDNRPIIFDYSAIRPAGVLLKTFGGYSSGCDPLVELHIFVRKTLNRNAGKPLTITTIADIMNMIGKAVVAGNVRRCVPAGTMVHTANELDGGRTEVNLVPVEKITRGAKIITHCGVAKVVNNTMSTPQIIVGVRTPAGVFRCSNMHRLRVVRGHGVNEGSGHNEGIYMPAGVIAPGSFITVSVHANSRNLPECTALMTHLNEKYEGVVPDGLYPLEILSIDYEEVPQICYDLTVDKPEFPCYSADFGIINHNSSEIALGDHNSDEFIDLKDYAKNPERAAYGWGSNNSVYAKLGMDYTNISERIKINGEPGLFWLDNAREFSRMRPDERDNKDYRARGTNPCSEQTLEPYELCCLVECFIARHDSLKEFLRTLKFAYLYAKTVTLGRSHWAETNRVMMRNRRIGCSLTGITNFLRKSPPKDETGFQQSSVDRLREWLIAGYDEIHKYDKIYSEWFCIPRSIKTTSIKPSGCLTAETEIIVSENGEPKTVQLGELFDEFGVTDFSTEKKWIAPNKKKNVINENGEAEEISALFINGVDDVFEVELTDGTVIRGTRDHKLLTTRGWVKIPDLTTEDTFY